MNTNRAGVLISFFLALFGNLSLGGMFLFAFLSPSRYADFVLRTGMLIFLIEFLSVHSSGMAFGVRKREGKGGSRQFVLRVKGPGGGILQRNPKFTLIGLYSTFVVTFALIFQNWFLPLYFFVSLLAKFFGAKGRTSNLRVGLPLLLFLGTTFFTVFFGGFLAKLFPIPPYVLGERLPGSSGLFVDTPQTFLVWGILYFFLMSISEVFLFAKELKPSSSGGVTAEKI